MIISFDNFIINESYSKVLNILRGDISSVRSLAILTAWNPMGKITDSQTNNKNNKKLQDMLRQGHFNSMRIEIPIYGKFGNVEKGFLIPHISKEFATEIAARFCQKAFIFGTKKETTDSYIEFEWIETDKEDCNEITTNSYKTTQKRSVVLAGEDAQSREDFYSAIPYPLKDKNIKPRKFWIPFFDDAFEFAQYSHGKRTVTTDNIPLDKPEALKKVEHRIIAENSISFVSNELPKDSNTNNLIKEINNLTEKLYDNSNTDQQKYIFRIKLNNLLKEMDDLWQAHQ